MPGGTRRPTRARACAGTAGDEPTTGGQSMPSTVTAGRDQSMSATRPEPSRSTPSSTCASARNCSAGYATPGHVPVPSRPWIVVLPCGSRRVASMLMSASSASGAGPPNMPECIGVPSVFTVTVTFASPRSAVVRVGTPTAKLPQSATRMESACSRSAWDGTKASRPPVPCSSEPSAISLIPTGRSPSRARRAVRCVTMLPLQSAAPRPYQRPLRSVSWNTGDSHAVPLGSSGGCTS